MAQAINPTNIFGSYISGRNARLNEQAAEQQNLIGQMGVEKEQQFRQLSQNPNATPDQYARMGRTDVANYMIGQQNSATESEQVKRERAQKAAPMLGQLARQLIESGDVRGGLAAAVRNPEVQRLFSDVGIPPEQMDFNDPELEQDLAQWAMFAQQSGPRINIQEGPKGSSIVTYGDTMRVLEDAPPRDDKPVLTEIRLPSGKIQKQWVVPGQASGTPVGEPFDPETGPSMKDVTSLRKEFESTDAAKQYRAVLPLFERAVKAPNTRAGDISMIYALGKMFDPTSVVREGELVLAQNAAPWLQKMASQANSQISAQGALNPETRKTILDALRGQVDAFRIPYQQERERYSQYANDYGIDPFKVVGDDANKGFDSAAQKPAVAVPKVGEVRKGYRYKGGDPSKPQSWEKVN